MGIDQVLEWKLGNERFIWQREVSYEERCKQIEKRYHKTTIRWARQKDSLSNRPMKIKLRDEMDGGSTFLSVPEMKSGMKVQFEKDLYIDHTIFEAYQVRGGWEGEIISINESGNAKIQIEDIFDFTSDVSFK